MSSYFISYQRDSKAFARKLRQRIQNAGIPTWMDDDIRPGEEWKKVIDAAINNSIAVIVVVTFAALRSPYVTYEWSFALGLGKRVIPLIVEKPDPRNPDHPKLHPKLDERQYPDFTNSKKYPWDDLIRELQEIMLQDDTPREVKDAASSLYSYDPNVRKRVTEFLLKHEHPSVVNVFAEVVRSQSPEVSANASLALARKTKYTDERAILGLMTALKDFQTKNEALLAIASYNSEAAIFSLLDAFRAESEESHLRNEIMTTAAKIKNVAVIPVLREMLRSNNNINLLVVDALGEFQDPQVVPELADILQRTTNVEYASRIIAALKKIKHPSVIAPLGDFAKKHIRNPNKTTYPLIDACVRAISEIDDESTLIALGEIQSYDFNGRYNNISADARRRIIGS